MTKNKKNNIKDRDIDMIIEVLKENDERGYKTWREYYKSVATKILSKLKENEVTKKLKNENERLWTYIQRLPYIYYRLLKGQKGKIRKELKSLLENFELSGITVHHKKVNLPKGLGYKKFEYAKIQRNDVESIVAYILNILIENEIKAGVIEE